MSKQNNNSNPDRKVIYKSFKDFNVEGKTGEVIRGKFTGTRKKPMFTKAGEPFLSVSYGFESEDGQTVTVINSVSGLTDELARIAPRIGDLVSVTYNGMKPKKMQDGRSVNVHSVKAQKVA